MANKKYLYIPIEVKKREMQAKIILSYFAALKGYDVIVGQSIVLEKLCKYAPNGIYLGTSIVKQHRLLFNKLKKNGHKIVAIDEEGLVYYNEKNFLKHRIDLETLDLIDLFLTWGVNHYELIESKKQLNNISIAGNIRFELLKPKYHCLYDKEIQELKNAHGKFILINTNLAAYNNFKSVENYKRNLNNLVDLNTEDNKFYNDKIEHQKFIFQSFINVANKLAKMYPEYNIILRPHPSEKKESYKKYEHDNLKVISDGAVIPWILASSCVLQQNCTTAIEAKCLNKPVFSYLPNYDERFDDGLPNKVVPCFYDESSLVNAIKNIINSSSSWREVYDKFQTKDMDHYVSNMQLDYDIMEGYLNEFDKVKTSSNKKIVKFKLNFLYHFEISLLYMLNKERRKNMKYMKQKFDQMSFNEVLELKKHLNNIHNNRFKKISIEKISSNTFLIHLKEKN